MSLTMLPTYLSVLYRLYEQYNWEEEESVGTYKLVPSRKRPNDSMEPTHARLRYWANLMRNWVTGKPLHLIIRSSISYFRDEGEITIRDFSSPTTYKTVPFVENDTVLINQIIEDVLLDIEVGLRFRIMRYLQNFFDISVAAQGQSKAGVDLASLVEYGTQDLVAVALQEAGLSRNASVTVSSQFRDAVELSDSGDLVDIELAKILAGLEDNVELAQEVHQVFG